MNTLNNIRMNPWTEDDLAFLRTHIHSKGKAYCQKELNRSASSIYYKARELGLIEFEPGKRRRRWTLEELEYLRYHYKYLTDRQIGERLNRNEGTVRQKRFQIGLTQRKNKPFKRWTEHEDEILKREYPYRTAEEVAMLIGCSVSQCKAKAAFHNLTNKRTAALKEGDCPCDGIAPAALRPLINWFRGLSNRIKPLTKTFTFLQK